MVSSKFLIFICCSSRFQRSKIKLNLCWNSYRCQNIHLVPKSFLPIFGRSVNPIQTMGGRFWHTQNCSPSGITVNLVRIPTDNTYARMIRLILKNFYLKIVWIKSLSEAFCNLYLAWICSYFEGILLWALDEWNFIPTYSTYLGFGRNSIVSW